MRSGLLPVFLAVLGGLLVAFVLSRVLDQAVAERAVQRLDTALERLAPELDAHLAAGESPAPRVLAAGRLLAVRVTLIAPDGTVLADSDVEPARLATVENHGSRPEVVEARRNGTGIDRRLSSTVAEPFLYIARRISGGHVARFAVKQETLLAAEAPLRRRFGAVSVGAGLVVGLLLVLIRRRHVTEIAVARSAVTSAQRGIAPGPAATATDEAADLVQDVRHMGEAFHSVSRARERELALKAALLEAVPAGILLVDSGLRVVEGNVRTSVLLGLGPSPPAPGTLALELLRDLDFERQLLRTAGAAPGTRHEGRVDSRDLSMVTIALESDGVPGSPVVLAVLAPDPAVSAPVRSLDAAGA